MLAVAYSPWHFQDGKIESPTEAFIYDLEAGIGGYRATSPLSCHWSELHFISLGLSSLCVAGRGSASISLHGVGMEPVSPTAK